MRVRQTRRQRDRGAKKRLTKHKQADGRSCYRGAERQRQTARDTETEKRKEKQRGTVRNKDRGKQRLSETRTGVNRDRLKQGQG